MKPQDILVLSKIHFWPHGKWTVREVAVSIHMAKSIVDEALKRMSMARLYDPSSRRVIVRNLEEFILHGLSYVFPAEIGGDAKGIPTAWSALPLKSKLMSGPGGMIVWPDKQGKTRGKSIKPLYSAVPKAVMEDNKLYELFSLIDALRCGKVRERQLAAAEIKKLLKSN